MGTNSMQVFNAAYRQYKSNEADARKIKAAKIKTEQDGKIFDAGMKVKKAQLEDARIKGDINEIKYNTFSSLYKIYDKQNADERKRANAVQDIAIDNAETEGKKAKQIGTIAEREMSSQYGAISPEDVAGVDSAMNQHHQSSAGVGRRVVPTDGGMGLKYEDTDSKKKFKETEGYQLSQMASKLYKETDLNNTETEGMSYPQKMSYYKKAAKEMVYGGADQGKKAPSSSEFQSIISNNNISDERQAVRFLIDNYGMNKESAESFILENR